MEHTNTVSGDDSRTTECDKADLDEQSSSLGEAKKEVEDEENEENEGDEYDEDNAPLYDPLRGDPISLDELEGDSGEVDTVTEDGTSVDFTFMNYI